jgi:PoNe immunity proteins (PoNi), C-terminal/PoNe immunity protein (PoNi), N-terminal
LEKRSRHSEGNANPGIRVKDPVGGVPDLARFFRDYDAHFSSLDHYSYQLRHMTARYSRGDSLDDIRREFPELVHKIALTEKMNLENYPDAVHVFEYRGRFVESFRDSLVVLTLGLCLRVSEDEIAAVLSCCERGDPLLETIAGAAAPGLQKPMGAPAFYDFFDRLYDALKATTTARERCVREYLNVWYGEKMDGLSVKGTHLTEGQADYVGYWCFEAAGVVAALDINDETFADHPHYPKDLVAFYRERSK